MNTEIFFGRHKYSVQQEQMTGTELRVLFGVPPTDNLFHAQGTKVVGEPIGDSEIVPLKNGEHFTSAPKNVTGGAEELPPRIRQEIALIEETYGPVQLRNEGGEKLILFSLPAPGWSPDPVQAFIKIPPLYPDQRPDLLFIQDDAIPPWQAVPRRMGNVPAAGRSWAQISWHMSGEYDPLALNLAGFASSARVFVSRPNW